MADYDRFWELHVIAPNGWYDFANGIAGQHKHQVEQHAAQLQGSMMLLEPLNAAGAAAGRPRSDMRRARRRRPTCWPRPSRPMSRRLWPGSTMPAISESSGSTPM